ncbi:phosphohydrolase [Halopiger aswanensis]|uniref:Uncharacterized protein n=1 Tax=Halopiger aswanensis TaxID=148449 RepID=A0A3R7DCR6_9EURY|nr:hypothetical protein ATJ93_1750 [Halopiger aswanensis]
MPEVTISDNLYSKLEEQCDDAIEDAVWELLYQSRRE